MKFIFVGGLGLLALVLLAAGLATPFATKSTDFGSGVVKMWVTIRGYRYEIESTGQSESHTFSEINKIQGGRCDMMVDMGRAILAFGIIGGLMTGAGSLVGFASVAFANKLVSQFGGLLLLGAAGCTLIVWPMVVAFYTRPLCFGEDVKTLSEDDYTMGVSAPLLIVAWLLMLAGGVAGIAMPDPRAKSEAAHSSGPNPTKQDLQGGHNADYAPLNGSSLP